MKPIAMAWILLFSPAAGAVDFASEYLDNWHQWRGPAASGVAFHGDPPLEWSEKKNVRWKVQIPGRGSSSAVVWGDRIFITTAVKTDRVSTAPVPPRTTPKIPGPEAEPMRLQPVPRNFYEFVVLCIDRESGRTRWKKVASEHVPHRAHHKHHGFASGSPTTDGRHVYASFGSSGIYCYDVEGQIRWSRRLGEMEVLNDFGETVTPVLHGDLLVLTWDHLAGSFIMALDARTGDTRWKVDRNEFASWSTPLVTEHEGRTQIIANGYERTRSYDLATGDLIWECGGQGGAIIPAPVRNGDLVFCMTGFRGDVIKAIRLDSRGDVTDTDQVVWQRSKLTPYVPSPLIYRGLLYFNSRNQTILSCVHADTGKPVFEGNRLPGLRNMYASPVGAAGKIYIVGRDGTTVVIKAGSEFEVLATNRLDDPMDASPAIVGKEMFLRGESHLYCIAAE